MVVSSDGHHAQIMRGVLDMCVLGCLVDSPSYGYELLQKLEEAGMPAGSEASIYLVLKRLKKHDLVHAELVASASGPARKVYQPTEQGRQVLTEWIEDWRTVNLGVETILAAHLPS
ncbi:MAG: PadR family transcriptional regulator [Acidimicrobiia bacterium]|nr:PadR family transcriptional regulator [Acidimicrobiia bacterium]